MIQLGPCACQGCGALVYWTGSQWGVARKRHICPIKRPAPHQCGAWMPMAREHCARRRGHSQDQLKGDSHLTRYAMDNRARSKRSGWAA